MENQLRLKLNYFFIILSSLSPLSTFPFLLSSFHFLSLLRTVRKKKILFFIEIILRRNPPPLRLRARPVNQLSKPTNPPESRPRTAWSGGAQQVHVTGLKEMTTQTWVGIEVVDDDVGVKTHWCWRQVQQSHTFQGVSLRPPSEAFSPRESNLIPLNPALNCTKHELVILVKPVQ